MVHPFLFVFIQADIILGLLWLGLYFFENELNHKEFGYSFHCDVLDQVKSVGLTKTSIKTHITQILQKYVE